MPRLRLGVALLLPSPVADEVNGLRRALGDHSLGRVPPHLTLVPPVNVRQEDLGRALAVLRGAGAASPTEITVTLGPPATFLPANPVLYLPIGGDVGAIHALRDRVWELPLRRTLTWPFVPHVTLSDDAEPEWIEAAMNTLASYAAEVTVRRVHLLVEHRPGPQWRPLADVAFGAPAIVARGGPLAVELTSSQQIDPEGAALLARELVEVGLPHDPIRGPLVVTARREGEVVGVGAASLGNEGWHTEVFVATAHRRQGIGRYLADALALAIARNS